MTILTLADTEELLSFEEQTAEANQQLELETFYNRRNRAVKQSVRAAKGQRPRR